MKNTFFIVGPTAVGKSSIAVDVAEQLGAEIVSADAFQIYDGLDILTAKPDPEAQNRVQHHLLGQISVTEPMSAVKFGEMAGAALADILGRNNQAIIVGGSGLYLKAITHGFAKVPPPNPKLRVELSTLSPDELRSRLVDLNPHVAARTDLQNPRRVIRAIEIASADPVIPSVSRGISERFFEASTARSPALARNDELRGLLLLRDREDLYQRINKRVNEMFRDGVEEEVRGVQNAGPTAAKALGLKEISALIAGQISREECIGNIQQATRRYAKRQLTWFRHQTTFPQLNLTPLSHREAVGAIMQTIVRRAQE